jgi:hypothetical protein
MQDKKHPERKKQKFSGFSQGKHFPAADRKNAVHIPNPPGKKPDHFKKNLILDFMD